MLPGSQSSFTWRHTNQAAPSQTPGTLVVPGVSNAYGATYTQIATGAQLVNDVWAFAIRVTEGYLNGVAKNHMLDVGIDIAGGTSYTSILTDLSCGHSAPFMPSMGRSYVFPLRIPRGSSVGVKVKGSHTVAGTVRVQMIFYGQPTRPEMVRVGQYAVTIGTITGTSGAPFTPGSGGVEGTGTLIGTVPRALWWYQLGVGSDDVTLNAGVYHLELIVGGTIVIDNMPLIIPTVTEQMAHGVAAGGSWEAPVGTTVGVRGSCDGTADTGWHAVAVGIGG